MATCPEWQVATVLLSSLHWQLWTRQDVSFPSSPCLVYKAVSLCGMHTSQDMSLRMDIRPTCQLETDEFGMGDLLSLVCTAVSEKVIVQTSLPPLVARQS